VQADSDEEGSGVDRIVRVGEAGQQVVQLGGVGDAETARRGVLAGEDGREAVVVPKRFTVRPGDNVLKLPRGLGDEISNCSDFRQEDISCSIDSRESEGN